MLHENLKKHKKTISFKTRTIHCSKTFLKHTIYMYIDMFCLCIYKASLKIFSEEKKFICEFD